MKGLTAQAACCHQMGPNLTASVLLTQQTHGDQRVLLLCPRILLGPDAKDSNQAAEGVNKVVVKKKISFDDYKKCVQNDKPTNVKINAIGTLKLTNYSLTQDKLALSNKDDKRVWFNKTLSRTYGHWRNEEVGEEQKRSSRRTGISVSYCCVRASSWVLTPKIRIRPLRVLTKL
jgi:hypothetical protein